MSAAAATATAAAPAAAPGGKKKKLILFGAIGLVLLLALAGGGFYWMQMKAAAAKAAAEAEDDETAEVVEKAHAAKAGAPTFMPLDPFVVNLADRETDRFAQIGVTLELTDAAAMEKLKAYMPAIRNGILLVLADKKSEDLLAREGKERLAAEILRESVRPLGIEVKAPTPVEGDKAKGEKGEKSEKGEKGEKGEKAEKAEKAAKPKKGKDAQPNPVQRVHFSSFIIQ
jgi:flagellar FliL protein